METPVNTQQVNAQPVAPVVQAQPVAPTQPAMVQPPNNTEKTVNLGDIGVIEIPKFDCKPFIGFKTQIAKVTEHQGSFGYYIKVETHPVTKFGDKDITASKIFGLYEDANGKIGWGINTKLGIYLTKMGVMHYKELIGKEVILQTKTNKEGIDFLDFN